jgi:hypothetical protein
MTKTPGRWVKKSAFVMPLFPDSIQVDPVLAALVHCAAFLELSEDGAVDPDAAVEAMEHVSAYLSRLPEDRAGELRAALTRLAQHSRKQGGPDELQAFLDDFVENLGVADDDEAES